MALNLSDLLYKEIEEGKETVEGNDKKGDSINNDNWKDNSDKNFGGRPNYMTRNVQNEARGSPWSRSSPSPKDNRRGRGNSRLRSNLDAGRNADRNPNRNEHSSSWRAQPSWQHSKAEGFNEIRSDAQELKKREVEFHPENEGIPGFEVSDLKGLLTMDSTALLMHLNTRLRDFITLLKRKLGPNMIMLVVEVLAKITSSTKKDTQAAFLAHTIQPSVLEQFSSLSFDIIAQNMTFTPDELIKYFANLYSLYNAFVQMMPAKASEILSDHCTRAVMALQNLKLMRKLTVPSKLEEDYKMLMDQVESLIKERQSAPQRRFKEKVKREWQPGIDFRQLSVHPLPQDLSRKVEVNLCPVVIDGPYKSVEHYLDVQFNLMREDFLIPLREGIANYIEQQSSQSSKYKRIENVRFYRGVRFLNQFVEGESIVTEVLFNPRAKSSRHNWRRSKRLLFGSLLCFTSDLFNSIILGLVVGREVELLEKGILHCELLSDVREEGMFKKEYIMAESEVYFEAYQHVLKALQHFSEVNFPLKEYLIDVSSDLHLPTYLSKNPVANYHWPGKTFPVLDESLWPSKEELKVNESQFRALHSALTKKCAVIQGPPGTGKTYLGLLIAKLLLKNSSCWRRGGEGPILVVCFTNHALDQFLEGILSFTKNIVRVGGQSKNENLDEYNLRVVRKAKGFKRYGLRDIMEDMSYHTWIINRYSEFLKGCINNAGIISLKYLSCIMGRSRTLRFAFSNNWSDSHFVSWLFAGIYFDNFLGFDLNLNDIEPIKEEMTVFYSCTLQGLGSYISQLQREEVKAEGYELEGIRNEMMMYLNRFHFMKNKLAEPFEPNMDLIERLSRVRNVNSLHPDHRWTLYKYWVSELVEYYQEKLMDHRQIYQRLNEQKLELVEEMYLDTISECDVVGMTTTGAAKHQALLQKLGPKIVIVEEAAEAMESHIVVCLSSKCEHLILIGDHKQLRPSPAVYKLAKDYHLEVSLFERLLMNGIKFDTLRIQHRMRPDIADLVFPAVYPVLENHPTVMAYDNVAGLKKNLFFITHTHPEETAIDDLSKKNAHEAEFLIALCRHIILQGYDCSQITILTTYLGQMFLLTEERDKYPITKDVRIAVVDNFQGEENDIILLSLVRNNEEGKIGFLASENRTCVALSRAKEGLYIMGNLDMLADKNSLWSKIKEVLVRKEAVGSHLTLQCLNHPEQLTEVSKAEDFNDITEGGCRLMCEEKLSCGHKCKKVCHIEGHSDYKCLEVCNRVMCAREHHCEKLCWQKCGECRVIVESTLPCGHAAKLQCFKDPRDYKCLEEVEVTLPDCGHLNKKCCGTDISMVGCSFPCDSRLPCGHACAIKCHVKRDPEHLEYKCLKECTRKNVDCKAQHMCQKKCFEECDLCRVKVKRKLPNCEHYFDLYCSTDPLTVECLKPCKKKLDCGHLCQRQCVEPCGGCLEMVMKEIPDCNHQAKMKCCEDPARRMCKEKCKRIRSCGHDCSGVCGIPCEENNCESLSTKTSQARCGHDVRLFCHEENKEPSPEALMLRCLEPCGKVLECAHRCKGTCAQCLQGRIHVTCREKCERKLICGHKCTAPCSQPCPQCKERCLIRCEHFRCKNKCGNCSPCKKKCGWQCEHKSCGRNCSDFCDRSACNERCEKKLECGHECIGFCGEKCPDLCRVCNPKEIEDALALLEPTGNKAPRFVLLPDCGHVLESTALDEALSMVAHLVKMLECPVCHVPIQQAYRYRNAARCHFNRVMQVKQMVLGKLWQFNKTVMKLADTLLSRTVCDDFRKSQSSLGELQRFIQKNKKAHTGAVILYSLEARMEFALLIVQHLKELRTRVSAQETLEECIKTANFLIQKFLGRLDDLSVQEHSDYENECMCFHLMMQLRALENSNEFKTGTRSGWYNEYKKCRGVIEDPGAFHKVKYGETRRKINEVFKSIPVTSASSIGFLRRLRITLPSSRKDLTTSEVIPRDINFDLHEGRWYECPNGHIFAVSECGDGQQTSNCDQCGVDIVGIRDQVFSVNDL